MLWLWRSSHINRNSQICTRTQTYQVSRTKSAVDLRAEHGMQTELATHLYSRNCRHISTVNVHAAWLHVEQACNMRRMSVAFSSRSSNGDGRGPLATAQKQRTAQTTASSSNGTGPGESEHHPPHTSVWLRMRACAFHGCPWACVSMRCYL